jgi:hypothetical protein
MKWAYVAASTAEMERARAFMARLRALGWAVHDWTADIEEARRRGWASDAEVPTEFAHESARKNRAAIDSCDLFVLLAGDKVSSGKWYEAGYADRGVRAKIIVAPRGNIFVRDWTRVESDEDALTFIALGDELDP